MLPTARLCSLAAAAVLAAGCGSPLLKLPEGPGVPAADVPAAFAEATAACRDVTSITAVAAVRGRVGGQRLRGTLEAGLAAPASARLEAIAPFGQPLFIFVARNDQATLLLPRDRRVLQGGAPAAVLEAVTGVPLDPEDLRIALTGCARPPATLSGTAAGDEWRIIPEASGAGELYLRRENARSPWRLVAAVRRAAGRAEWRAEYREFLNGLPQQVRIISVNDQRFDIQLSLSQVEVNTPFEPAVFEIASGDAEPITLDELRRSGPLADAASESPAAR